MWFNLTTLIMIIPVSKYFGSVTMAKKFHNKLISRPAKCEGKGSPPCPVTKSNSKEVSRPPLSVRRRNKMSAAANDNSKESKREPKSVPADLPRIMVAAPDRAEDQSNSRGGDKNASKDTFIRTSRHG